MKKLHLFVISFGLLVAACDSSLVALPVPGGVPTPQPPTGITRAGTVSAKSFLSDSGETVAFQVFEPATLVDGQKYPLVLHGHGYGQSRCKTEDANGDCTPIKRLREMGIGVISFDQRGFGDSGGSVRILDPDFEGHDLVALVDWAEANLDWLAYRDGNLVLGAYGGSYGGGFQLLLQRLDPKKRLDVLAADTTWHDLRYSLNPQGVFKSVATSAVFAVGEQGSNLEQDNYFRQATAQAAVMLSYPPAALNWLNYHSPDYVCDAAHRLYDSPYAGRDEVGSYRESQASAAMAYRQGSSASRVRFSAVDVLLSQGMRDTLFNFNESYRNYRCLTAAGGDVRLLTHQSGHILGIPTYQGAAGPFACGVVDIRDAQVAWFKLKLLRQALTAAESALIDGGICLSLAADDAYYARPEVDLIGGSSYAIASTANIVVGSAADRTRPTVIPIATVSSPGAVLGGIPRAHLSVTHPAPVAPPTADPIFFVGLGVQRVGTATWVLIDDMLTPVRGLKTDAAIEMNGLAERLAAGDQLAFLVYGNHTQFLASYSRDASTPAVNLSGRVELPIREGVLVRP